jgi:hypothetical protein
MPGKRSGGEARAFGDHRPLREAVNRALASEDHGEGAQQAQVAAAPGVDHATRGALT